MLALELALASPVTSGEYGKDINSPILERKTLRYDKVRWLFQGGFADLKGLFQP